MAMRSIALAGFALTVTGTTSFLSMISFPHGVPEYLLLTLWGGVLLVVAQRARIKHAGPSRQHETGPGRNRSSAGRNLRAA
jgi:hypothetical protein